MADVETLAAAGAALAAAAAAAAFWRLQQHFGVAEQTPICAHNFLWEFKQKNEGLFSHLRLGRKALGFKIDMGKKYGFLEFGFGFSA